MSSSEVINVLFQTQTKELDALRVKLEKTLGTLSKMKNPLGSKSLTQAKKLKSQIDSLSASTARLGQQTSKMGRFWEGSTKEVWGFNGALLSTLFFGMEMQRVFGTALKSMFEGYKKIIPESHAFNVMTTKLSANWEFFKFQLADALSTSPIFQKLIEMTIGLVQALQKLPEPVKAFLGVAAGIGFVTGAFLKFFGIIGLGVAGIKDINAGFVKMGDGVKNINKLKLLSGGIGLSAVAGAAWFAVEALDEFYNSSEYGKQAGEELKETWTNTINSALNPLSDALGGMNIKIENMAELFVLAGVTVHNALLIFGAIVDVFIYLVRVIGNLTTSMSVAFTMIKSLAQATKDFFSGDFADAAKLLNPFDVMSKHIDQVKTDMADMGNAWDELNTNFTDKSLGLKGYAPALEAFRAQRLKDEKETTGETTNINVMMMSDALANGTITNEQYAAFMAQTQFQSGN